MAGYNHRRGMSNNALKAYRRNLKPISRFTAQDLRHANIEISLAFARWLAKEKLWSPSDWHHSSKYYNKVNFYNLKNLRRLVRHLNNEGRLEEMRQRYLDDLRARRDGARGRRIAVRGKYARWEGTGKHRRIAEWVPFKGIRDGNGWIHLPDGTRKKASSKWVKYRKVRPNRNARQRRNANITRCEATVDGPFSS